MRRTVSSACFVFLASCAHIDTTATNDSSPITPVETAGPGETIPEPIVAEPRPPNPRIVFGVAGIASCAIVPSGELYCWGRSPRRLDDRMISRPLRVDGVDDLVDLAVSEGSICVLDRAGAVRCNDILDRSPEGDLDPFDRPIEGLPTIRSIAVGALAACAIDVDGAVRCWGQGYEIPAGEASCPGDDDVRCSPTPRVVPGVDHARLVAVRNDLACAILETGRLTCWGKFNRVGLGLPSDSADPTYSAVEIPGFEDAQSIALGSRFGCIATTGGDVRCWHGTRRSSDDLDPRVRFTIDELRGSIELFAHDELVCGRIEAIGIRCVNAPAAPPPPTRRPVRGRRSQTIPIVRTSSAAVSDETAEYLDSLRRDFDGATRIALAWGHGCLLDATGALRCWGDNGQGAVGDPFAVSVAAPVLILAADGTIVPDDIRESDVAYRVSSDRPPSSQSDAISLDFETLSLRDLGAAPRDPSPDRVASIVSARIHAHGDGFRRCFDSPPTAPVQVRFIFAPGARGVVSAWFDLAAGPERTCLEAEVRSIPSPRTSVPVSVAFLLGP